MSPRLLLTGGVVKNLSLRTAACLVKREHRHQVCVATLAVIGTIVASGVADLLSAVTSLDEGRIAVSIKHCVPCQGAVSF